MGRSIPFPSLAKGDEFGFVIHSSTFEYDFRRDPLYLIAPWAGMYQTYGDRNVQHSADTPCPLTMMGDYLASLATFCMDQRNEDALEIAADHWKSVDLYNDRTKTPTILKARAVRHKEGKRRYVQSRDFAISAAESKRHDRRWHEIVEWMDGSVNATFGLLCMDSGGIYGLERYLVLNRINEAFYRETDSYFGEPEHHFPAFKGQRLDDAFKAFECLMTSHLERKRVEPLLECYARNVAHDAERAASATG